jgi:hypothetical protein
MTDARGGLAIHAPIVAPHSMYQPSKAPPAAFVSFASRGKAEYLFFAQAK